jgi:hypothetical protein
MKPQDILFFLILFFFLYKRNSKWTAIAGLVSLLISIPLFAKWVFFTAERLTWYAAGFFLLAIVLQLFYTPKTKK